MRQPRPLRRHGGLRSCRAGLALLVVGLLLPGPAAAQLLMDCAMLEGRNASGVTPALRWRLAFANGQAVRVVINDASGAETTSHLTPLRPGLSYRSILHRSPGEPLIWRAVFNLVMVEPEGTVLVETWVRHTSHPAEERYSWNRLRCTPQG